ncbi:MAG: DUF1176 domain-containing protein [Rhizobiaceae bacterium]
MLIRSVLVTLSASLAASAASAQELPYIDNRSDAASLVKSLYNAINRKEYGRAWSYYRDQKPAKTVEAFGDGYTDTKSIQLRVGAVTSEGAAGSTFFNVPVAIEATGADDQSKVFAGCYTARLANPQVQGDNFQPLHIEKGSLKPSDEPLDSALPQSCGEGQPVGGDAVLEQAKASYVALYGQSCDQANSATGLPDGPPADNTIKYRNKDDAATDPERTARLISFPCFMGAYNTSQVYYLWDEISGLKQVEFPTPDFDVVYENPDDTENSKVKEITVTGFYAVDQVINSEFDPAHNTIISWEKWRGVGDASSNGTWTFRDGNFVLVKYDVDASYDGEIDAQTIVDYESAP